MVLACHSHDRAAEQLIVDEIGECGTCWHDVALAAVDAAAGLMIRAWPLPEMGANNVATSQGIDWILDIIDGSLEAEALDRGELERGP